MKRLLFFKNPATSWLEYWKTLFLVLSIILSLFVHLSFDFDLFIFVFAILTSIFIGWSVSDFGTATVQIPSTRVAIGWGFINYALFVTISSLFIENKEWGITRVSGFAIAFILSLLLTRFCSYISYLLKLSDIKEDEGVFSDEVSKFNGISFYILFSIASVGYSVCDEGSQTKAFENKQETEQKNILYSKETWQPVIEWHTEILQGNTLYIVKCQKGRLGIYPSKYPKIRDINANTQIKFLAGETKGGLIFPERLEIRN